MGAPLLIPIIGPALAKIGMGSQLAGLINIGGAVGGLSMLPMAFGAGQPSEEEQERMLRRQLEIQDEFEQQRAQRGGLGDMQSLVGGGGGQRDLLGLILEEERTRKLADMSRSLGRASGRPGMSAQLESLLAGEHARLAQLQSERTMSPLELIQFAESM